MAQHDYVIANGTGAAVRSDLNNALAAIVSQNSGATEPATMYAYQWWADTTTGLLKLRNGANNAWITLRELDGTLTIEAGTVSAPGLAFASDLNTGVWSPGADQFAIATNGVERVEWGTSEVVFNDGGANYDFRVEGDTNANLLFVDASADAVGIGSSTANKLLQVGDRAGASAGCIEIANGNGSDPNDYTFLQFAQSGNPVALSFSTYRYISGGNWYNDLRFNTGAAGSSSTKMTLTAGGSLGIGTTSPGRLLQVSNTSGDPFISILGAASNNGGLLFGDNASDAVGQIRYDHSVDAMHFATNSSERARIDSSGAVLFKKTTKDYTTEGTVIAQGASSGADTSFVTAGGVVATFARSTNDGTIISLRQDGTEEGTISVSGTTISYNGAHLSRWSQLPSGAERTEILRGSVLSNIDEMCEWGNEDNEQLNRMKVSDVEGDKNVSGVFQCWDDDDDTYTNDFYCAMTGDFIIRIAEGVTVERGDLLMSAGDGTAKPQDDDIIRSKTIAKVTSTTVSCTYEDGSYCVPCVLMAC